MQKLNVKNILISLISIVFLFSCKSTNNLGVFGKKILSIDEAYYYALDKSLDKNFSIKYNANINHNGSSNKISGQINFIDNNSIIINAVSRTLGIEIIRAYFSKDSVLIIDKINKQYYKGDYKYLNKIAGYKLSFYDLRNLLLGQLFSVPFEYNRDNLNYFQNFSKDSNYVYEFDYSKNSDISSEIIINPFVNHKFILDKHGNLLVSEIKDINSSNKLILSYNYDKSYLPDIININSDNLKKNVIVNLEYKQFDNKINKLNFNIPESYIQIK